MRFDFNCDHKLTDEEKEKAERYVNEWIQAGLDVSVVVNSRGKPYVSNKWKAVVPSILSLPSVTFLNSFKPFSRVLLNLFFSVANTLWKPRSDHTSARNLKKESLVDRIRYQD
mgnify:CR=1 FL=1